MRIISLITDFGYKDYYLAELKASLYNRCNDITILDISHDIPIYDISLAAFKMKYMMKSLPKNSINLIAVNNFYIEEPRYLIILHEDRYFIAPDNGVLSLLIENIKEAYVINTSNLEDDSLTNIYTHAIACLNVGLALEDFAFPVQYIELKYSFMPVITQNQIKATIIHVDHYGNVVTNCTLDAFEKARAGRSFAIYYKPGDPLKRLAKHYGEVGIGEPLALFNPASHLEIALNLDNASDQLHLYKNETIQIDFY
jgi:S-adenosyl-L-methionine hydrolase (adenosine-forming)